MSSTYTLKKGNTALLISMPHNSSCIPQDIAARMHPYAQASPDTDWLLNQLFSFAEKQNISVLKPHYSRYVIDLNRSEHDENLYPGSDTTGLCPVSCFDRRPIYLTEKELSETEIKERITTYWKPYHTALQNECERLKSLFNHVILFEAHSIASRVPRFFEGELPHLNLGTYSGKSCHPALQQAAEKVIETSGFSWVSNGRFKGGHITRAYGNPEAGIHTLQLEISQAVYMNEETGTYVPAKAIRLQPVLDTLLQKLLQAITEI